MQKSTESPLGLSVREFSIDEIEIKTVNENVEESNELPEDVEEIEDKFDEELSEEEVDE